MVVASMTSEPSSVGYYHQVVVMDVENDDGDHDNGTGNV
jgi:hypothetical protein